MSNVLFSLSFSIPPPIEPWRIEVTMGIKKRGEKRREEGENKGLPFNSIPFSGIGKMDGCREKVHTQWGSKKTLDLNRVVKK